MVREEPAATSLDTLKACPVRRALDLIDDKWAPLIIHALAGQTMRFSRMRREIDGVSQKVLTQTLRRLERDGIVARTVYPTVPATVEYALTPLGRSLNEALRALNRWSEAHTLAVEDARAVFDRGARSVSGDGGGGQATALAARST